MVAQTRLRWAGHPRVLMPQGRITRLLETESGLNLEYS